MTMNGRMITTWTTAMAATVLMEATDPMEATVAKGGMVVMAAMEDMEDMEDTEDTEVMEVMETTTALADTEGRVVSSANSDMEATAEVTEDMEEDTEATGMATEIVMAMVTVVDRATEMVTAKATAVVRATVTHTAVERASGMPMVAERGITPATRAAVDTGRVAATTAVAAMAAATISFSPIFIRNI